MANTWALKGLLYHGLGASVLEWYLPGPPKCPKIMAQYPTIGEYGQYRVHSFGAILPLLSVLGYWAIILGISVHAFGPRMPSKTKTAKVAEIGLRRLSFFVPGSLAARAPDF